MRRAAWLVPLALVFAQPLAGQIVRGQVVDSITGVAVPGGRVELLDAFGAVLAQTTTNEEGRFLLRAPAPSRYRLRVSHDDYHDATFPPFELAADDFKAFMLLAPPLVAPAERPDPDMSEFIERVCPENSHAGQPILTGIVQDADGNSVEGAAVVLRWSALPSALSQFTDDAVTEGTAITGSSGFYVVCGAPRFTDVTLQARRFDSQSALVSLNFGRRSVTSGDVRVPMSTLVWQQDFVVYDESQRMAEVLGTVTDPSGRPLGAAIVEIRGTTFRTETDGTGAFRLRHLPPGTMALSVTRLGYGPVRTAIALDRESVLTLPDSILRMRPAATTIDPVVVEADRSRAKRVQVGFERRRSQAQGRFITREEFYEMGEPSVVSDILKRVGGFRVRATTENFSNVIFSQRRGSTCYPLVFRDNLYIGTTDPNGRIPNLDVAVPLGQVDAIEMYNNSSSLPAEFSRMGSSCGAIVFWTTPPRGQS
ncbi:MAG: carboxypeptidase regulatory-like domain-containing protein [Gemmatimonadetes bacterium]|nr:carboxypeptidase regulatory-like domain-containing protein [Gemmatimonadota bacterium]